MTSPTFEFNEAGWCETRALEVRRISRQIPHLLIAFLILLAPAFVGGTVQSAAAGSALWQCDDTDQGQDKIGVSGSEEGAPDEIEGANPA